MNRNDEPFPLSGPWDRERLAMLLEPNIDHAARTVRTTLSVSRTFRLGRPDIFEVVVSPAVPFRARRLWTNVPKEGMLTLLSLRADMRMVIGEPLDAHFFSWRFQENEEAVRRALGKPAEQPPADAPCWIDIQPHTQILLRFRIHPRRRKAPKDFTLSVVLSGAQLASV